MSATAKTVRVTAVLACHNRKAMTLRCLASLKAAIPRHVSLSVMLFDDASSDGTGGAVRDAHPDVRIIRGDGKQFWCGGMRAAMRAAANEPYDYLLWLNDDVRLDEQFLKVLLDSHRRAKGEDDGSAHVIVGALADASGKITYTGLRRTSAFHPAKLERVAPVTGHLAPCDTMNGNCVLFSRDLVERVGEIDSAYVQQIGDVDYGYRCAMAGAKLWVAPRILGSCEPNLGSGRWSDPRLPLRERLKLLNSPHGMPFGPWLHFMVKFGGALGAGLLFLSYGKSILRSLMQMQR